MTRCPAPTRGPGTPDDALRPRLEGAFPGRPVRARETSSWNRNNGIAR